MALTKCRECGHQISTKATLCPSCGAKIKRTSKLTLIAGGLFAVVVVSCVGRMGSDLNKADERQAAVAAMEAAKPPEQKASEAAAKAKTEAEFQRVVLVLRMLKASLHNPASFELVRAGMVPGGAICVVYRATNKFNATVAENAAFDKNLKPGTWNKLCGGKSATDYTSARHAL
jgi:hypothetical protein